MYENVELFLNYFIHDIRWSINNCVDLMCKQHMILCCARQTDLDTHCIQSFSQCFRCVFCEKAVDEIFYDKFNNIDLVCIFNRKGSYNDVIGML